MFKHLVIFIFFNALSSIALADYKKDIGYKLLIQELGSKTPTGKGVVVAQAEPSGKNSAYMPNIENPAFKNKIIIDQSSPLALGPYSGHATGSGKLFFGNNALAKGIKEANCYSTNDWLTTGYLNADRRTLEPKAVNDRIANHSWIGGVENESTVLNILKRIDWVINRDEFIQAVGIKNNATTNSPMLSAAFNVIAAGKTDGKNGRSTKLLDTTYVAGRTRPHLVVPVGTSSAATPIVASAIALLIETGHNNPELSTDPEEKYTKNRKGDMIFNAERSEVIKAALMAGADKKTNNSTKLKDDTLNNITDYRGEQKYHSTNGLDIRYGAGQLNIHNSYKIISGGEQNNKQDHPENKGAISKYGFDYDPSFGDESKTSSYFFSTDSSPSSLSVSLVWNVDINKGKTIYFPGKSKFYNLNLSLYSLNGDSKTLVAESASEVNNSENISIMLEPNSNYLIQVNADSKQAPFEWDFAIAWQITNS
ncbi:MAG: hypothetical protein AAGB35_09040 [Pseudomonadota bacterium]